MAVSVGDIFVALGFKVDSRALKGFDSDIQGLTANMVATTGAIAGALYGLERFVSSSTEAGAKIANVAEQTGIGTSELQKLAYAANAANSSFSFDNALNGLAALRKSLYDISVGKGNNSAWQILGIDPNGKTPTQLISELAQATHGLDRARATDLLDQTGLGKEYLRLLEEVYNNPNFIEQTGGPLVISDKDIATLAEGDRILNNIWKTIQMIKAEVTVGLFDKFKGVQADLETERENQRAAKPAKPEYLFPGLMNPIDNFLGLFSSGSSKTSPTNPQYLFPDANNAIDRMLQNNNNATNTGDTNVQITVNGAEDPQQTASVIQDYIQAAQDQRARSMK